MAIRHLRSIQSLDTTRMTGNAATDHASTCAACCAMMDHVRTTSWPMAAIISQVCLASGGCAATDCGFPVKKTATHLHGGWMSADTLASSVTFDCLTLVNIIVSTSHDSCPMESFWAALGPVVGFQKALSSSSCSHMLQRHNGCQAQASRSLFGLHLQFKSSLSHTAFLCLEDLIRG